MMDASNKWDNRFKSVRHDTYQSQRLGVTAELIEVVWHVLGTRRRNVLQPLHVRHIPISELVHEHLQRNLMAKTKQRAKKIHPGVCCNIGLGSEQAWKYHLFRPDCAPERKCDTIAKKMADVSAESGHLVFPVKHIFSAGTLKMVTSSTWIPFIVDETNITVLTKLMMSFYQLCMFLATAKILREEYDVISHDDAEGNLDATQIRVSQTSGCETNLYPQNPL